MRDIFKVSRRMVADKYIKPYISGIRRELPSGAEMVYVACTWMKWCQDEEEGKKLL